MEHWKLSSWCHRAVCHIVYPPDRKAVFAELLQHLNDRSDGFLAEGLSPDAAADKTLEVMGDPFEIARQLKVIHRPFWGYAYSIVKWFCVLFFAVIFFWGLLTPEHQGMNAPDNTMPVYLQPDYSGSERTFYAEPGSTFTDSGYTVTLRRVAVLRLASGVDQLHFLLSVNNPLPWAADPAFFPYIHALDNLGRVYPPRVATYWGDNTPSVAVTTHRESYPFWERDCELWGFDAEGVEWVDLIFDFDGRNHVLRIDLTGGDSQ